MSDRGDIRHSKAEGATVVEGSEQIARKEASNSLRQAERVRQLIVDVVERGNFRLRPSTLLDLNRIAIEELDAHAGVFRPAGISIGKSRHQPPGAHLVAELVEDSCDYVNSSSASESAIHCSAMVMWRLNWIHPFTEGNGRTSRAASYFVLCGIRRMYLPGTMSIPEQIESNRAPYYEALEAADAAFDRAGELRPGIVNDMEKLIGRMLARQLGKAFEEARS